jgi:hypothetical protein
MLLVFALIIVPISAGVGVVAVDAAMWQSERRGAQKDADLASLAGAYELLDANSDQAAIQSAAKTAVARNAADNDEADNASIIDPPGIKVDNTCFNSDVLDSVTVNIDHDSRTFFADFFGVNVAPNIGAHARACMGSPIEGHGLLPLGVQVTGPNTDCFEPDANGGPEIPVFGQYCQLAFAGSDLASGEGGFLKLFNDGSSSCSDSNTGGGNTLQDEIAAGGAATTCYVAPPGSNCSTVPAGWPYGNTVNYCVWPKTQTFNNPTQDAFWCLIRGSKGHIPPGEVPTNKCPASQPKEGDCDAKFGTDANDYDDWMEVVEAVNGDPTPDPGTTTFARRDCKSPRLVDLVIVEQFDVKGNEPRKIVAFASFYIQSCIVDGTEFRDCNVGGGQIGQAALYGFFMNILDIGTIGAINDYGQRAISLWE